MTIQPTNSPGQVLQEAAVRARNMAVAAGMIAFLLVKLFGERVLAPRARALRAWCLRHVAGLLVWAWRWLAPRWERLKAVTARTRVRMVRRTLEVLIRLLTPVEEALLVVVGRARQRSSELAERGAVSLAEVLRSTFNAIGALVRAGFSRPAVQGLLSRLLELAAEAQKPGPKL
ncbi:MAG: hypothetical protein VKQ33_15565 [Candidatus Sericytochromatia bacterium]|nr:hypothetical protein [Candidatus Sericytochromatia bacterium]